MPRAKTIEEVMAATELALSALVEKYRRVFVRLAARKSTKKRKRGLRQLFGRVVPSQKKIRRSRAAQTMKPKRKSTRKGKSLTQKKLAPVSRKRAKPS